MKEIFGGYFDAGSQPLDLKQATNNEQLCAFLIYVIDDTIWQRFCNVPKDNGFWVGEFCFSNFDRGIIRTAWFHAPSMFVFASYMFDASLNRSHQVKAQLHIQ